MKTWHFKGMRFYATLLLGEDSLWHLWVTAACGKNDAKKLRAEIRLSSNLRPDCNDVFYRPGQRWYESSLHGLNSKQSRLYFAVLHYGIPISKSTKILLKHYTPFLNIHEKVVWQHVDGGEPKDLLINTSIPFTINIFEKVFLAPDKADMDEKDESGQDKEDGEIGRKDESPNKMMKMLNDKPIVRMWAFPCECKIFPMFSNFYLYHWNKKSESRLRP